MTRPRPCDLSFRAPPWRRLLIQTRTSNRTSEYPYDSTLPNLSPAISHVLLSRSVNRSACFSHGQSDLDDPIFSLNEPIAGRAGQIRSSIRSIVRSVAARRPSRTVVLNVLNEPAEEKRSSKIVQVGQANSDRPRALRPFRSSTAFDQSDGEL